jgi:hypothetical protein
MVTELFSPDVVQANAQLFLGFLLSLVYAVVILFVGTIAGNVLAEIVKRVFDKIKFEEFMKAHKVEDALGTTKIDSVLVQIVKYYVILIFLADALKIIQLGSVGTLLNDVVLFMPVAFAGAIIVVIAAVIGELAKEKILEMSSKSSLAKTSAKVAKFLVIYVGVVVGLGTMGFEVGILEQLFNTLLQGLVYGIALAFGIAFGLGGQEDAKDMVKKTRRKLNV